MTLPFLVALSIAFLHGPGWALVYCALVLWLSIPTEERARLTREAWTPPRVEDTPGFKVLPRRPYDFEVDG